MIMIKKRYVAQISFLLKEECNFVEKYYVELWADSERNAYGLLLTEFDRVYGERAVLNNKSQDVKFLDDSEIKEIEKTSTTGIVPLEKMESYSTRVRRREEKEEIRFKIIMSVVIIFSFILSIIAYSYAAYNYGSFIEMIRSMDVPQTESTYHEFDSMAKITSLTFKDGLFNDKCSVQLTLLIDEEELTPSLTISEYEYKQLLTLTEIAVKGTFYKIEANSHKRTVIKDIRLIYEPKSKL